MILLIIGLIFLIFGLITYYLDRYVNANKGIHNPFIILGLVLIALNITIILLTPYVPCIKNSCGYACYGDCGEDYYKNCLEVVPCEDNTPKGEMIVK